MIKIDKLDRKLLFELDKNASLSLARLSKILKRSKQTIDYRMRRLEKIGIIKGYQTVIDMSCLGFITYRLYIKLQNSNEETNKKIFNFFKKQNNLCGIALMQGKWDLAVFFGVKNVSELHEFFDKLMISFKMQIKEFSLSFYQPIYFFARNFFLNEKVEEHELKYGIDIKQKFDNTDLKIIEELKNNARIKNVEIAEKLRLSLDTIIRRRKLLETKKIIAGYKLILDYAQLGYTAYRVDFYLNDFSKKKQLFEFCKNHKNIYCVNEVIAGADFEIALAVKNHYEFNKIIQEILTKFPDVISSYDYIGFSTFSFIEYIPD